MKEDRGEIADENLTPSSGQFIGSYYQRSSLIGRGVLRPLYHMHQLKTGKGIATIYALLTSIRRASHLCELHGP